MTNVSAGWFEKSLGLGIYIESR